MLQVSLSACFLPVEIHCLAALLFLAGGLFVTVLVRGEELVAGSAT